MVYFSQLKTSPIFDVKGKLIGNLRDLVFMDGKKQAEVTHFISCDEENCIKKISWSFVKDIDRDLDRNIVRKITLNESIQKINPFFVKSTDVLVGDMIDKQVVDIDGVKVVRINDILLSKIQEKFCVIGVAVGKSSFFRRLGLKNIANNIQENIIPWRLVERLDKAFHDIHLNVQKKKIADLHPEDIADIMEDLSHNERLIIFNSLDKKKAAKTLIGAEHNVQESIFKDMKIEKIKNLIEEIPAHQAADLLEMMAQNKAEQILRSMRKDIALKIRKIMNYTPDSAGSIMKTDFISIPVEHSAEEAINKIKNLAPSPSRTYHIYVIDAEGHLSGILSTRALLFCKPNESVENIMNKDVISVKTTTNKDDIAKVMARYDLLVLPVVDSYDKLVGIVTADDVITKVIPERWIKEKIKPHTIKNVKKN